MHTIGSLFSGIGGLELGLEAAGLGPVLWQAENAPFQRSILDKHWPGVLRYDDVADIDSGTPAVLICGGFPCQDISVAGAKAGLEGERSGLWKQLVRSVGIVRPRWVVVGNTPPRVARDFHGVRDLL